MADSDSFTIWHRHGSSIFIGLLSIVTAVLITLSIAIHDREPAADIIGHLAEMFSTALIATLFFSLHDVRETLAASIGTLLVDGHIVHSLSQHARDTLATNIVLEDTPAAKIITESLLGAVRASHAEIFGSPHLHNYAPTIVLSDVPDRPDLVRRDFRCTYVINTDHLKHGRCRFRYRFRHEVSDPSGVLSRDKILTQFEARIGDQVFTIKDIEETTERHAGGLTTTVLSMQRDLDIVGQTSVSVSYDGLGSRFDPNEIMVVRFPTRGYRVTLWYTEGNVYDVAWFRPISSSLSNRRADDKVVRMRNGVTAYTDDWLLPGNGVVLYWFSVRGETQ